MDKFSDQLTEAAQTGQDSYVAACQAIAVDPPDDPSILSDLRRVFALSDFVASTCIQHPELLKNLIDSGDLQKSDVRDSYTSVLEQKLRKVSDETELGVVLRKFRLREMVRIAWRDLTAGADLFETMLDLSALADTCVNQTFSLLYGWLCGQYGKPVSHDGRIQNIVVLGMGKLGARELNFSSDIDLIFCYPEAGKTQGESQSITNDEFFLHLTRRFIKIFGAVSPEGILFRVDMRLRPYGEGGPLVMNFDALEEYYQNQGREWERYALIKSRVIAGDKAAGRLILDRLRPFIYRRYLDYAVYDALRDMKQKIAHQVQRKNLQRNIKLGAGGIREIEFFGQIFQLIRGGVEPVLQERSILAILRRLVEGAYISQQVCDELTDAYFFLRMTEHHLQEMADQQTHDLPSDSMEKLRLAVSMNFTNWDAFKACLQSHMQTVHRHFDHLLIVQDDDEQDDERDDALLAVWQNGMDAEAVEHLLASEGFARPQDVVRLLDLLRNDYNTAALSQEGRQRLDRLMPLVLKKAGGSENPMLVLNRMVDLIKTIQRRTCYIALLLENPTILDHLINLISTSSWIASFLTRHPVLLDELLDTRTLYSPPRKEEIVREIKERLTRVDADDFEHQLEELCIVKQINMLRVAAADISGNFPLMKVSDHLTDIAEIIVGEILELVWRQLTKKYGRPTFFLFPEICEKGFAVIAYGKLGGIELGYHSDLDLVFLHAGAEGETDGERPVDNNQFFARLGQRIVHALTAHTRAGALYETDMRLRPSGSSGMIVSRIEAFRDYYIEKAWIWEHQALVRARAVCGDPLVARRFNEIRSELLTLRRQPLPLQQEVRDMRERVRRSRLKPEAEFFDLKEGHGGMVDIEFLVQYLVLLKAADYPELTRWTDNVRLLETLARTGSIPAKTANALKSAYLVFRSATHRLNLQDKPARIPADKFRKSQEKVLAIWNDFFLKSDYF